MNHHEKDKNLVYMNTYEHTPKYSIKEVSDITGISAYTLRYYDKVNLFPFLQRNEHNIRVFSEADIEWVKLVDCLRKTNMSIAEIKHYVELNIQGPTTINKRYEIICQQEIALEKQLEEIKKGLDILRCKKSIYKAEMINLD